MGMGELHKNNNEELICNKSLLLEILYTDLGVADFWFNVMHNHPNLDRLYAEYPNYIFYPKENRNDRCRIDTIIEVDKRWSSSKLNEKFKHNDNIIVQKMNSGSFNGSMFHYSFALYNVNLPEDIKSNWNYLEYMAKEWEKYIRNTLKEG